MQQPMITACPNAAMSSDLNATIQGLIALLPPGTEVEVQIATVVFRSSGGEGRRPHLVIGAVDMDAAQSACPPPSAPVDSSRMTAVERVEARLVEVGDNALNLKDWAALVFRGRGPSERELKRAVGAGLLPHSIKAIGKDAGAVLVYPNDLLDYLRKREVAMRSDSPPEIWKQVVGGRFRTAA